MDELGLPARLGVIDAAANVMTGDIMLPFAFDEVCGRQVGEGLLMPTVHIWRHKSAFVLGTRDWKLPQVREAVKWLQGQGYSVTVRNSGGAAVPLDPGVVNLSLILPNRQGDLDVQRHFVLMAELIRQSLKSWPCRIDTGEVSGSYCPGEFDVSVKGKKFCGIAQRRQTRAVIVQAFVLVEGSGEERGRLVKAFYDLAAGRASLADYPIVEPMSMSSLSELAGDMSADAFVGQLKQQLSSQASLVEYDDYSRFKLDGLRQTVDDYRRRYPVRG
ncbi:lipoate--protein ligase family protein [Brevibacillus borstelensis]|uniref:lipoate--protein ligase family protein n=1 Tax=Brevibacillus borstelensis TaxID=45462 RepID=UPI0030BAD1CB